jgi:hypothetical protein
MVLLAICLIGEPIDAQAHVKDSGDPVLQIPVAPEEMLYISGGI